LAVSAGKEVGKTLLSDGVSADDETVNETELEWRAESGLLTRTLQVPGSLPSLNW
jgi:hypothetical protein